MVEHKNVAKIYSDNIVGKGENKISRLFAQEYFHNFLSSLTGRTLNQAICVSQTHVYDGPLSTFGVGVFRWWITSKGGKTFRDKHKKQGVFS